MRLTSQVEAYSKTSSVNFREGVTSKPDAENLEDPDMKWNVLLKDTSDLLACDEDKGYKSKDVYELSTKQALYYLYLQTL